MIQLIDIAKTLLNNTDNKIFITGLKKIIELAEGEKEEKSECIICGTPVKPPKHLCAYCYEYIPLRIIRLAQGKDMFESYNSSNWQTFPAVAERRKECKKNRVK